jgi:hypothetical protein
MVVPKPITTENKSLKEKHKIILKENILKVGFNFSRFNLKSININKMFNNHFENSDVCLKILSALIGGIFPKLSQYTITELIGNRLCADVFRFHKIENENRDAVFSVLREYGFKQEDIDQMSEGNHVYQFSGILGGTAPRVVCELVDSTLFLLFIDVNHHIYINERHAKDGLFYEYCPININSVCYNMPHNCFAFDYLDEEKLRASSTYEYSAQSNT